MPHRNAHSKDIARISSLASSISISQVDPIYDTPKTSTGCGLSPNKKILYTKPNATKTSNHIGGLDYQVQVKRINSIQRSNDESLSPIEFKNLHPSNSMSYSSQKPTIYIEENYEVSRPSQKNSRL